LYEGPEFVGTICATGVATYAEPIHYYAERSQSGEAAVIGGGVYHAVACSECSFPSSYEGDYFFADYYSGFLRRLELDGGTWRLGDPVLGQPSPLDWGQGFEGVSDFIHGPDGALWYCRNGTGPANGEIHRVVYFAPAASAPEPAGSPARFAAPFPSPARGSVTLSYTLSAAARVELDVVDVTGRRVEQLVRPAIQAAGRYETIWHAGTTAGPDIAPGVYLARLRVNGASLVRRLVLIR
jgi:hypothetical protein